MHKPLNEYRAEKFDAGTDKDIEWQSIESGDLPAEVFFEALRNIFSASAQNVEQTIILDGEVVGSQLQLYLPAVEPHGYVMVRDNEILVDNLRIVIDLVDNQVEGPVISNQ